MRKRVSKIAIMSKNPRSERITTRIIRNGSPEPRDEDWTKMSPEERIEAVWTLTRLCFGWNQPSSIEPRLQRNIIHIKRAQR